MSLDDDTKLVKIDREADILEALMVLAGSALLTGNRRLYEHIALAKRRYEAGDDLRRT